MGEPARTFTLPAGAPRPDLNRNTVATCGGWLAGAPRSNEVRKPQLRQIRQNPKMLAVWERDHNFGRLWRAALENPEFRPGNCRGPVRGLPGGRTARGRIFGGRCHRPKARRAPAARRVDRAAGTKCLVG
jgi:hypothetical protein